MLDTQAGYVPLIAAIRALYGAGPIPLHRPAFEGNERRYLVDCIDSNFVSSVGARVTEFEERVAAFTGAGFAVATVNGTAALHVALRLAGVGQEEEVITQALTFVATCNATRYCGAWPVFVDVDRDTLGLSPAALRAFLERQAERRSGGVFNRASGRRLAACVPMHTFGIPGRIAAIVAICDAWGSPVVEDAAESQGSYVGAASAAHPHVGAASAAYPPPTFEYADGHKVEEAVETAPTPAPTPAPTGGWRHTGTFGRLGVLSFNGNKIITTGGGGMILTDDAELAARAKHLTTTAKVPHPYEFVHDETGYNYRLPNLNAALGCAQMERLPEMLAIKAEIAARYAAVVGTLPADWADAVGSVVPGPRLIPPPAGTRPNHWLNAVLLGSLAEREAFLAYTNSQGVMTRPVWRLMNRLAMYADCQHDGLEQSIWLEERVVSLPSSVPAGATT